MLLFYATEKKFPHFATLPFTKIAEQTQYQPWEMLLGINLHFAHIR
jgi:hypothetical protein